MATEAAEFGPYNRVDDPTRPRVTYRTECTLRIAGLVTGCMAVLAFILCLAEGSHTKVLYLQAINILLSSLMTVGFALLFRSGKLGPSNYWLLVFVFSFLLLQSILSDIIAFHFPTMKHHAQPKPTTVAPATEW